MYYKHKFLVASPLITDPVFSGSVVFLFGHNKRGAEGVILNSREVGKVGFGMMQDLFNAAPGNFAEVKDMMLNGKLQSVPLHLGGPCQTPGLYFLHGHEEFLNLHDPNDKPEFDLGIPQSFNLFGEDEEPAYKDDAPFARMKIMDGVYFGTPFTFGAIIEAGKMDEGKFRFYTGQSAWGPGQLEYEVGQGAWTVVDGESDLFFDSVALKTLVEVTNANKQPPPPPKPQERPKQGHWFPHVPPGFDPSVN